MVMDECFLCGEFYRFGEIHEHGPKRVDRLKERVLEECPELWDED
jgi:hypothetical protein